MSTINERLSEYLRSKKISDPDVYKKIGVGQSIFAGWIKQGRAIPLSKVQAILNLFPDLNARWLLTGQKPYTETDPLNIVSEPGLISCPFCVIKNDQIKNLELHRDDLRKQISLLEFSLGKNAMKA